MYEIVTALQGDIAELKLKISSESRTPANTDSGTYFAPDPVPAVNIVVHKTLLDVDRRKHNVIVSGIAESSSGADDSKVFTDICEQYLNNKPAVKSCFRIRKL